MRRAQGRQSREVDATSAKSGARAAASQGFPQSCRSSPPDRLRRGALLASGAFRHCRNPFAVSPAVISAHPRTTPDLDCISKTLARVTKAEYFHQAIDPSSPMTDSDGIVIRTVHSWRYGPSSRIDLRLCEKAGGWSYSIGNSHFTSPNEIGVLVTDEPLIGRVNLAIGRACGLPVG